MNSTITTWGKEGEKEAFRNMLEQVIFFFCSTILS